MDYWPTQRMTHISKEEILKYADDPAWQRFRESMQEVSTREKLDMLDNWWMIRVGSVRISGNPADFRPCVAQCVDYINALKSDGRLDENLKVIK